jgi:hypothetical protein
MNKAEYISIFIHFKNPKQLFQCPSLGQQELYVKENDYAERISKNL